MEHSSEQFTYKVTKQVSTNLREQKLYQAFFLTTPYETKNQLQKKDGKSTNMWRQIKKKGSMKDQKEKLRQQSHSPWQQKE